MGELNHFNLNTKQEAVKNKESVEYTIVGAGPAALCAIAKLVELQVPFQQILWIDPVFQVGDFGTKLSAGSSIPSNTKVMHFQRVNDAIYEIIPFCAPTLKERQSLEIYSYSSESHCPLRIAAEPMQKISDKLRKLIPNSQGSVLNIQQKQQGLELEVKTQDGKLKHFLTQRAILAIGARPKTLTLPSSFNKIVLVDPYIGFIESACTQYLKENHVKAIAVIGSSHSAALAVMNFRKAGVPVKQFMNKPYRFARPQVNAEGVYFIQHDNTGLKGEVAEYIQALLDRNNNTQKTGWECFNHLLDSPTNIEQIEKCSHALVTVGYEVSPTLHVNDSPITNLDYNRSTLEIESVPNLFGFGIAFPQEVKSLSGEMELGVGYNKFWTTANTPQVIEAWTRPFTS